MDWVVFVDPINSCKFNLDGFQDSDDTDVLRQDPVSAKSLRAWDAFVCVILDFTPDPILGLAVEVWCNRLVADVPAVPDFPSCFGRLGVVAGLEPLSDWDTESLIDEQGAD